MDVVLHTSVWIVASLISCNTSSGAKWVSESLISKRVFKVLMDAFAWSLARWVSPSMIMASAWMKAWTTGWKIRRHFLKSWMPFAARPLAIFPFIWILLLCSNISLTTTMNLCHYIVKRKTVIARSFWYNNTTKFRISFNRPWFNDSAYIKLSRDY